ncbi:MAG: sugar nucleotide-binding protein, partial [Chloroflexi bacterium]|nr:sugar nucleotide-binding protein [Chloroflexota bacterium]
PTYVKDLAEAIARLITTHQYGTYHLGNSGACSRWEFANEILRLAGLDDIVNTPILGKEFERPSVPPPYCALNNLAGAAIGITLRPWPEALAEYMEENDRPHN